ncbi:MAG TPA: hypothetical protein DC000_11720 [Clostridiales bacterium]|nr:hypothetical protein [Clostridiales bacterium]
MEVIMIKILRSNIEDAQIITEIKTEAYNKEIFKYLNRNGGPPGYDNVDSQIDIINKFLAYKIMLDDIILGAFFLVPVKENIMWFEDFVIKPEYQGKGYGYHAMGLVEKSYPNIKEWKLTTPVFSVGNQHLYTKFGYQEIKRDEDMIEYSKFIEYN